MSFIDEFKTFAMRGNVVDLAVGFIIGTAFGKIVSSLVADVIMPPIGLIIGGVDFSNLTLTLKDKTTIAEPVVIKYGTFLNTVIDFLIIAFVIFLLVKIMNKLKGEASTEESSTIKCPECLMEIPRHAKRCGHCTSNINGKF